MSSHGSTNDIASGAKTVRAMMNKITTSVSHAGMETRHFLFQCHKEGSFVELDRIRVRPHVPFSQSKYCMCRERTEEKVLNLDLFRHR